MLVEKIKELVFNLLGAVYSGVVGFERAGDRQILACYDHRRCRHRPLSICNLAIASEPLAVATYMQDRELASIAAKSLDRLPSGAVLGSCSSRRHNRGGARWRAITRK